MVLIQQVSLPADITAAVELIREFTTWAMPLTAHIENVPTFGDIDSELTGLPGKFTPHFGGRLLLAKNNGQPAGCIALTKISPEVADLKRLYVRPEHRGQGIGWQLVDALLGEARRSRYKRLVLDSHVSMTKAHQIYGVVGFARTEAPADFPADLAKEVVFMELTL